MVPDQPGMAVVIVAVEAVMKAPERPRPWGSKRGERKDAALLGGVMIERGSVEARGGESERTARVVAESRCQDVDCDGWNDKSVM